MAIYFFYGDEDYNIEREIEQMRKKLNPDFISMSFHTFNSPDYTTLITALRTPPMMFGDMLIVINSEEYFLSNKNFFTEVELADIEDALNKNPDSLNIVFVVKLPRNEKKKLDTRRKLYKILSKYNIKEFPTFKSYQKVQILSWLKSLAKSKNIIFKEDAAELLAEQIGNNLRQFDIESDKLKLMAHPEKIITKKMVEQICITNQDLFNLTDNIIQMQKDRAVLEYKKLLDKKHPLEILTAVQTMLRKWIILKSKATELSVTELANLTEQPEFVVKQTLPKLKKTTLSDLVKLKQHLFEAEYKIKSAESIDIASEVECAIIR